MAIPEFVLKKLVVPGSFRFDNNEFSFKLLNTFAPATINRFRVLMGSEPVSESDVSISSKEMTPITCENISPESPIILPVGIEVLIKVKTRSTATPVTIVATTREVGDVEFSLTGKSTSVKYAPLKAGLFSFLKKPKRASISVSSSDVIGNASPFIPGHFIEHLERCIYDGIWTSDGSALRSDTLDLIRQLNPSIIRYPGGNFASGYHWEDGIGPREKRPQRHDAAWQASESNQVGTDEFIAFCREIKTEPLLVVNDGSGTPEEAARWVSYCNSPADTEQGARRAANGHPEPYNVRYWGVGNEVWGAWQIGTTSATEYCKRLHRFVQEMKSVDPSIIIVAVGNIPLTDDPVDPATLWNKTVLESAGNEIDYLSWHIYQPDKESWKEQYDALQLYKSVAAAHLDIEMVLKRVEKQIKEYSINQNVLQAVDEWNLWLPPREKNVSMHHVTYTMRDALYVASVLITFYRNCQTVGMANIAQMVNVLPLIETNSSDAIATSIFYPFVLFSQMESQVLHCKIESEEFDSPELDQTVVAHSNVPYLDGLATLSPDGKCLKLLLINRYPLDQLSVSIDMPGTSSLRPVSALELSAKSSESFNSYEKPTNVTIRDGKMPEMNSGRWMLRMKPCSIYMLEFAL